MPKQLPSLETLEQTGQVISGYPVYRIYHGGVRSDPQYASFVEQPEAKRQLEDLFPGSIVGIVNVKWGFFEFIFLVDNREVFEPIIEEPTPTPPTPPAPIPFDPSQLASIREWWRTDSGITVATGVSSWIGKVLGEDLVQATTSRQPLVIASQLNGFDAIRFDGGNDYLDLAAWAGGILSQPATYLFVYRKTGGTSFADYIVDGASGGQHRFRVWSGTDSAMAAPTIVATDVELSEQPDARALALIFNGASSECYANGGVDLMSGNPGTDSTVGLTIGALRGGGGPISMDLFEVVVADSALSAAELNQWGAYVTETYGLPWTDL